jgi:DNA-binding MarR family transcriptional regulator
MAPATFTFQPLARRLRDGLDRICAVLRNDQWQVAGAAGLNPTQAHVLIFAAGREEKGVRVGAIADHLGVTQPTATDSIAALIRKGLLTKSQDPSDARGTLVRITETGRHVVRGIGLAITATERALETLSPGDQTQLLQIVVKTIRALQVAGAIAPQRLCVTCRYFRPNVHDDALAPHHCAYVDAAFGTEALRLDCPEHGELPEFEQELLWSNYAREVSARKGTENAAP